VTAPLDGDASEPDAPEPESDDSAEDTLDPFAAELLRRASDVYIALSALERGFTADDDDVVAMIEHVSALDDPDFLAEFMAELDRLMKEDAALTEYEREELQASFVAEIDPTVMTPPPAFRMPFAERRRTGSSRRRGRSRAMRARAPARPDDDPDLLSAVPALVVVLPIEAGAFACVVSASDDEIPRLLADLRARDVMGEVWHACRKLRSVLEDEGVA
jgi:hypothetical protein